MKSYKKDMGHLIMVILVSYLATVWNFCYGITEIMFLIDSECFKPLLNLLQHLQHQFNSSKLPLIVWMVQPRLNETLLDPKIKSFTNHILDRLNSAAQELLKVRLNDASSNNWNQCFLDVLVFGRWRWWKQKLFSKRACVLQTILAFANAICRTQAGGRENIARIADTGSQFGRGFP